jgi:hypothetical protein
MTACTESIHVDGSPERVGAFLEDVHNLPRWTGFFRSVGPLTGDRWEVVTAMGTTIRTRIEHAAPDRYAISSLVGEREERAELIVLPEDGGARVSFTVKVLPALAEHHGGDAIAVQRDRMRAELRRLRGAVTRADV